MSRKSHDLFAWTVRNRFFLNNDFTESLILFFWLIFLMKLVAKTHLDPMFVNATKVIFILVMEDFALTTMNVMMMYVDNMADVSIWMAITDACVIRDILITEKLVLILMNAKATLV